MFLDFYILSDIEVNYPNIQYTVLLSTFNLNYLNI